MVFNPEQLTVKAQQALQRAQELAESRQHRILRPLHVLKSLLDEPDGLITPLLHRAKVDTGQLSEIVDNELGRLPQGNEPTESVSAGPETVKVLNASQAQARLMKDDFLSTEHLLIGLIQAGGQVKRILEMHAVEEEDVLEALKDIRGNQTVTDVHPEDKLMVLEKYGRDLVELARQGKVDPVIGRDTEIRRVIQVLSRRRKNNPVLIGEPGVGKTAIVEGLAHRIVLGDVPQSLKDKQVFALDMGALIAGAKFRGEFEDRLKAVLKAVQDSSGQIVMFIDELHTVVGAGASEGAMDASNLLKPALARGDLHCVGATTLDEYRKYIEKDAALERRFQPVVVQEPSVDDTISILRGLKDRYESHHGVRITDNAIISAATLSERYISDRFLPDKAIDLIDEAASRLRMEIDSMPAEIDEATRQLTRMQIEATALERENGDESRLRLSELRRQIAESRETTDQLKARWEAEKSVLSGLRPLKEEIEQLRAGYARAFSQAQQTNRNEDFQQAFEAQQALKLKETELCQLESRSLELADRSDDRLLREDITQEDIARVVSLWTGIPVARMMQGEREKLMRMEEEIHKRMINQHEAVTAVANAVRRARSGMQDANRPIGSFIFPGPTGVGKTELCKALAEFMFDDERSMVRVDMSEFMEPHSVARLIGAPPGYVGYEEGGRLTEAVRRNPYCVILLDEIEKAHRDVFNVLLQLLDDGRLTDGHGRTVDFTNTIVIMTSNIGSQMIMEMAELDDQESIRSAVDTALRREFLPEFLNRVDEVIVFHPLARREIREIVDLQIGRLAEVMEGAGYLLNVSDHARQLIASEGYDPVYGARPVKRVIQQRLQNGLASEILSGRFKEGDLIQIDATADGFVFTNDSAAS